MKYPDRNTKEPLDGERWQCRNTTHDGRCANGGTIGYSTVGHGGSDGNEDPHAYCALHFPPIGTLLTLEPKPLGLGEPVGKLQDDPKAWARRIIASREAGTYNLIRGIECAREALGIDV